MIRSAVSDKESASRKQDGGLGRLGRRPVLMREKDHM
jgi:hypothetical protein